MEHLKGKLDYNTYSGGHRELVVSGSTIATICNSLCAEANAAHFVTCWNAYDGLKAKEALFNDLVHGTEMARHFCEQHLAIGPNPTAAHALLKLNTLLTKAKELQQ